MNSAKKVSRIWTMSKDEFAQLVKENHCIVDIVEKLGYSRNSGSTGKKVKERIIKDNIDNSHFKGRQAKSNGFPKYDLKNILVKNSAYTNITRLKIRIINKGLLEYKCAKCGNRGEWNGEPITLQLDHKNGNNTDHRLENIRFLCPNCHSQTKNFSGRNIGKYS